MTDGPTILLRSSWQTQNIGDIAHTPGMLALLERHVPEARVILWYNGIGNGVEQALRRRFPTLRFVPAADCEQPKADYQLDGPADLRAGDAMATADILLHGSGPALIGEPEVARFHAAHPDKPWGAIGVTLQTPRPQTAELLRSARFLHTRETHSIDHLAKAGVTGPEVGFAPDASFVHDLRDEPRAEAFLREVGLLGERFICVIPRLRTTPYYKIHIDPTWTADAIARIEESNARHAEPDHAKLRAAIVRCVRETGRKVLLCAEMTYEVELQRPLLFDLLPDDVKPFVVNRETYWRDDEAASVYRRCDALLSLECHSPILCAANGVSGFYVRHPSDTIKGQMWYDLGLSDRVAEIDQTDAGQLAERFMRLLTNPTDADRALRSAMDLTHHRYDVAMASLRRAIGLDR